MGSKKSKKKARKVKIELTRTSFLLWSLVFLLFLGWIFALGIFVGKGMLPQSITSTAGAPTDKIRDMMPKEERGEPDRVKTDTGDPELTFYRKLSSKKEEAAKREEAAGKNKPDREIEVTAPPRTSEISDHGRSYAVQIASLDRKDSAEELVKRLKAEGYRAYAYKVKLNGKFFYRVRCGTFNTLEDAIDVRRRVAQTQGLDGIVIRTDNQ